MWVRWIWANEWLTHYSKFVITTAHEPYFAQECIPSLRLPSNHGFILTQPQKEKGRKSRAEGLTAIQTIWEWFSFSPAVVSLSNICLLHSIHWVLLLGYRFIMQLTYTHDQLQEEGVHKDSNNNNTVWVVSATLLNVTNRFIGPQTTE